ncbi:MAG: ATP-binding protein [Bifidobacterium mongoliense]|jgi:predicted HTH transcriptional regulator|uniref:AlbA family DNA-binding domain-containing protein n=1 Tax=Bifidobacterium mongoliense TaxID=518643 RepID=UPI002F3555E6
MQIPLASNDIEILSHAPEGQYFDRKSARIKPHDLAKIIVAMANSSGGKVAVGIEDIFEDEPVEDSSMEDIDHEIVGRFKRALGSTVSDEQALRSARFLTKPGILLKPESYCSPNTLPTSSHKRESEYYGSKERHWKRSKNSTS